MRAGQDPIPGDQSMKNEAKAGRHLREANNAFKAVRTEKPMTDYAKDQQSLHENHERLKAARLAREAKSKAAQE